MADWFEILKYIDEKEKHKNYNFQIKKKNWAIIQENQLKEELKQNQHN